MDTGRAIELVEMIKLADDSLHNLKSTRDKISEARTKLLRMLAGSALHLLPCEEMEVRFHQGSQILPLRRLPHSDLFYNLGGFYGYRPLPDGRRLVQLSNAETSEENFGIIAAHLLAIIKKSEAA